MARKQYSKKKLWEVQNQEFSGSIELDIYEVYRWAQQETYFNKWRSIAMALQYPKGIWYYIPQGCGYPCFGYRFGVEGGDYLSFLTEKGDFGT